MVKNKTGGNKSKGLARKALNAEVAVRKLFLKEDAAKESAGLPGSYFYAKVARALGDCRFLAECDDGQSRTASCKHMNRSRRENNVELGSALLVGVADYHASSKDGKLQACQILALYTPAEAALIPFFQPREDKDDLDDLFNVGQGQSKGQDKAKGQEEDQYQDKEEEAIDFSSI